MKIAFFVLFIGQLFMSSAQDVFVIERSDKTEILFDPSNSRSLVQILKQNLDYLAYFEFAGILETDLNKLTKEQRSHLIQFIGRPGTTPLFQDDPNLPGFGDPLIVIDANGLQAFAYEPPDTIYTDLTDLIHIVLDLKAGEGNLIERTTAVTFCKSYGGETIPVLRCEGNALLKLDGFKVLSAVGSEPQEKLLFAKKESYWNQLRDSMLRDYEPRFGDVHFLLNRYQFGLQRRAPAQLVNLRANLEPQYTCRNSDLISHYPFDFWLAESLKKDAGYLQELQHRFDSVIYSIHRSNEPMFDEDPNSPSFGEILIVTRPNGLQEFVYPDPEIIVQWLVYAPKIYKIERLINSKEGFGSELMELLAVQVEGDEEHLVSVHDLDAGWTELLKEANTLNFDWTEWRKNFNSSLQQGKGYDLSENKMREKLKFSDSFWLFYE